MICVSFTMPVRAHLLVLALTLTAAQAATADDRIFADGMEPCCRIGGTVSGLSNGGGATLHLSAGAIAESKSVAGNGLYDFRSSVSPNTGYTLSLTMQPIGQTCSFTISTGTMGSTNISDADVICTTNLVWDSGTWGQNWN